jgi:hypothetical protein
MTDDFSHFLGISFLANNNIVISCGMDGHLFRSDLMTDSNFPHKKLRMTALGWNVRGEVATTAEKTKRKNIYPNSNSISSSPSKMMLLSSGIFIIIII